MPAFQAMVIPVTPYQQNCTLLWCEKTLEAAVIDPGGEVGRIVALAAEKKLTITKIFLTHGHLDHASGAAALKEKTGAVIEGPHRDDTFLLEALDSHRRKQGFEEARACTPDRFLTDGDSVSVGEVAFSVVHCPGHTPGHVVLVNEGEKIAFCGDVLFKGSIGRTDFPRGDHALLIRSIVEKLWPLGRDMRFLPGHGPMSTFGQERASNPFVSDGALDGWL